MSVEIVARLRLLLWHTFAWYMQIFPCPFLMQRVVVPEWVAQTILWMATGGHRVVDLAVGPTVGAYPVSIYCLA